MRSFLLLVSVCVGFLCGLLYAESSQPPFNAKSHCFDALSSEEKKEDWAKEYLMGVTFAGKEEYLEAQSCFKRALLLCPEKSLRVKEIEYAIILSHYLNQNYSEVIKFFERHSILYADSTFGAYHDLMIILYHCYEIIKEPKKADLILQRIEEASTDNSIHLMLAGAVLRRNFESIEKLSEKLEEKQIIKNLTETFLKKKKSEIFAKWLNVFVPGLGYFYLGQRKAALTSFLINAFLIVGTSQLFLNQYYTLGSLTALLEIGWYVGGIFGAKHSTYLYNETLFANYAEKIFYHENLSPQNKLNYEF